MDARVDFYLYEDKVEQAVTKAAFKNLGHAAASIRKDVIATITPSSRPSAPGTPPHTRTRQLTRAIVYDVDKGTQTAVIGPRFSFVGESGAAHEFGGWYKDRLLPERPFMAPGLERGAPRFAAEWEGSIGE